MTAGPAASRRVGINGRTSPPPDSSLPEVCSFQLPKVCSFRLPLTRGRERVFRAILDLIWGGERMTEPARAIR